MTGENGQGLREEWTQVLVNQTNAERGSNGKKNSSHKKYEGRDMGFATRTGRRGGQKRAGKNRE